MNHAKLLDCTLRDGAYLIDKKFGDTAIHGIIKGLLQAKVDLIEIGFLQNDGFGEGKTVFLNGADAERFVPKNKGNSEFTVLADFSRYSIDNLDDYTGKSFDAVRACFFKSERYDVLDFCRAIKAKGYKLFVQPVDILGYSDVEIIELINLINEIEPYCLSIVDTFGSMYVEDLQRIYSLIDHNLVPTSCIGFHSHNNMQMSSALSQEFLRMTFGKRKVIVDTTVSGMGRGAGNTPTELVAQYMVDKLGYTYDIDAILDITDNYMDNIRARSTWGYDVPHFLAGCYSAHVNNIAYLTQKNSIRSKDIRYILNKIGAVPRKRYDYDLLENTYVQYLQSNIDDTEAIKELSEFLNKRNVVVIVPGSSASTEVNKICKYIEEHNSVVVSVNFVHDSIKADFIYMSNVRRYNYWINNPKFFEIKKILTSNIRNEDDNDDIVVSFSRLIKCGWEHMDNSTIMLLRLLDQLSVSTIAIAGFDGYSYKSDGSLNYASKYLELSNVHDNPLVLNQEISEMLKEFVETRKGQSQLKFITDSRFENIINSIS